ncbi:PAS domain S-box-containing protein/diguanylate cyclase (GGDEF) domain-containing protein [Marinobacter daqiaonensis]|uniref:PAS domain S-box-containing protein/diguanylate cyclase (GGDEF) domain-containing protein n=1 Tax=Marinobacter daqiaonensis TaxID=650891 RepID=A0A1I6HPR2_9GAMM|nr:EAL domain-containing protein [Marinobacter daqiaonensis]SFR56443.1 PAS domain S-box-containing protein/diguanylate cyclase (GGDEF) domain-containing protein [Marinobacter daqiaonensis]
MSGASQLPPAVPSPESVSHYRKPVRRPRLTLGRKLLLVTLGFVLIWSAFIGLSHLSRTHTAAFTIQINEAGKLRMFSQRIAFIISVCHAGPPDSGRWQLCDAATLEKTINDYNASLEQVERTPFSLFLEEDRKELRQAIRSVRQSWEQYSTSARLVAGLVTGPETAALEYVEEQAEPLLKETRAMVQLLVDSQLRAQAWRDSAQNALQIAAALLLAGVATTGYRHGVRPLRNLVELTRLAGRGDFQGRIDYHSRDEIGELAEAFNETNARTQRLIADLQSEATAARRAEEVSESLFEAAADGILISDPGGQIIKVNREAEQIFAYRREELLSRNVDDLLPEPLRQQHRRYVDSYSLDPRSRSMGRGSIVLGRRSDGSEIPLEISLSPVLIDPDQRVIAVVRDVSARMRAEADRQRLITILDMTPDVTATFATNGALIYLNPAGRHLLGITDEAPLAGWEFEQLLTPLAGKILRSEAIPTALECGLWHGEMSLRDRKGTEVPVSQLLIAHPENGEDPQVLSTIARDISERKEHEAELLHRATHDSLTGLANRVLFKDRLKQAIRHAERDGHLVAIMFIDLDNFKLINDTMGHGTGDMLLCEVARRLQVRLRSIDTKARLSGDEFAVILENLKKPEDAASIIQGLAEALHEPIKLPGRDHVITSSMGVSLYPTNGTDAETLLMQADSAMYQAKASGKACYHFYNREMNLRATRRLEIERELRHALERNQLTLYYQPIVNAVTATLEGCEVLLRWQHPDRGLVSPAHFIPVAEETGLIVPIGEWVLRQACKQAQKWRTAGLGLNFISVNISANQLRGHSLVSLVRGALEESQLPPGALELELTEGSLLPNTLTARDVLEEIRAMGVRLVADDFGTGYSSLSYLKIFRFDKIKIDCQFVRDMLEDAGDAAIARATIAMAHAFDAKVVGEGVETPRQAEELARYGCDQLQGYLFDKPLPEPEFSQRLPGQRG